MKKIFFVILLCVVSLLPSRALAQSIFGEQQVIVWEIFANNLRNVSPASKEEMRTTLINAFQTSKNYEVFECSIDDIKNYIKIKGWRDEPKNRIKAAKELYPEVDYIIFPAVKISDNNDYANEVEVILEANMYDISVGRLYRSKNVSTPANLQAMPDAYAKLLSQLLGETITPTDFVEPEDVQTPMSTTNTQPFDGYIENVGGLNIKMIRVEGGTFTMGATPEQGDNFDSDERPIHDVALSEFYISECEITQAQWKAIMGTSIQKQRDEVSQYANLYGDGNTYPMYYVSYYEALEFCEKLSKITGREYTLPTEAQWEYAARGGKHHSKYKFSGYNQIGLVGWYKSNSNATSHPVGRLRANKLGIRDMTGNVWEWCLDFYYKYTLDFQKDPVGSSSSSRAIIRGGSYGKSADECRISYRMNAEPTKRDQYIGFRIVCIP